MSQTSPNLPPEAVAMQQAVVENRTWFMVLGIALVILGIVAIIFPFMTTIAAKIFLGWLFLIGGVVEVIHAFSTQKWSAFFLNLLIGVLYVVVGAYLAFLPLSGILTLTIVLAALFIAEGVLQVIMAFRVRGHGGWGWMLFSGVVAIAVGIMIWANLPSSAVWAIGLLVGVNMITSGWAFIFLASAAGKMAGGTPKPA
jgi:uncharacterized membrane protein HdeD (DUF308 family)